MPNNYFNKRISPPIRSRVQANAKIAAVNSATLNPIDHHINKNIYVTGSS